MPRTARRVFAGLPHHVVQRANRGECVFFHDADHSTYLDWMQGHCAECGVEILAYCLMTNHVHAVLVPGTSDGLERALRPLHTRYAMRVNRLRGCKGRVWQGRYFSSTLDESYMWTAIRYVERNPVRAGMVVKAEDYRWSSAAAHCGETAMGNFLTRDPHWMDTLSHVAHWPSWLADVDPPARVATLRQRLYRNLPCGAERFVRALERRSGTPFVVRPRGRPGRPREKGVRPLLA